MSLQAALEALHQDAGMWDEVSRVTNEAGQAAAGLTLTEDELSWASVNTPLLGTYQGLQDKIVRLLGEATTVYTGLSTALDKVAAAYEASDERAARDLKGVWDVRD
jgi:hypothetical protein